MPTRMQHDPQFYGTVDRESARDDQLQIAHHIYRAMCAQYPDRLITLYDGTGRVLENTREPHRPSVSIGSAGV